MTRKFKALGLALFAVMAMGALAAQGAQAAEFHSSVEPAVITGELHPEFNATGGLHTDRFEAAGLTVECDTAKFEGTQATSPAKTVTLTPTYGSTTAPSGCKASSGNEAIVHTNHCAYVFSSSTTNEDAPVEVQCSGTTENEILVTIPGLGATLHIAAQNKIGGGVHYTNAEAGGHKVITTHTTAKEIATTCTGIGCFFTGTSFNTKYEGTETIKAFKDVGCTEATGTAKTTPSLAACEGEQGEATYE